MTSHAWAAVPGGAGLLALSAAQSGPPEAVSLLGKPLFPAPIAAEARKALEENLRNAEIVYGRNPDDPDATIWVVTS
jgi:hypothetical protein